MRRVIVVVTAVIAVLASATASYVIMRNARGGDPAPQAAAQPGAATPSLSPAPAPAGTTPSGLPLNPDTSKPGWYEPYLAEERRPAYDQVINGITVGPTAYPSTGGPCTPGSAEPVPISETVGTSVQIAPKYLPPFTVASVSTAVRCHGVVAGVTADYSIPSDPAVRRFGGYFMITRQLVDPLATWRQSRGQFCPWAWVHPRQ